MSAAPSELEDHVAVVTGGGRGIGAATARALGRAGAAVAVLDRDADAATDVAESVRDGGGGAIALHCDVIDEAAVERAFEQVADELGGLDVLVNNAGTAIRRPAVDLPLEDWVRVIEVNLTAVFVCSRLAARRMIAGGRGGSIVNLASIMGLSGGIFPNASYQASKGGVVNLTRALALEWAADKIRVNAVAPTFVRTDLTAPIFASPDLLTAVLAQTPLGELPEPEDVAEAIVFLAGPRARTITGTVLPVDAGYLAR